MGHKLFLGHVIHIHTLKSDTQGAVYLRQGITSTLGITNGLTDGGQSRVKKRFSKRDLVSLYVHGA